MKNHFDMEKYFALTSSKIRKIEIVNIVSRNMTVTFKSFWIRHWTDIEDYSIPSIHIFDRTCLESIFWFELMKRFVSYDTNDFPKHIILEILLRYN